jgi:hypothetical protein
MVLCSQAKLENDNRGINVKRGLRTRVEMGLWPAPAPTGYLKENRNDRKCETIIDPERAPVVKKIFEKVAYERWTGRKVYNWLKFELNFRSAYGKKHLSLGNVYKLLENTFYYGTFEYPRNSGNWYVGKHEPLITKELFDQVQAQIKSQVMRTEGKEFAFTKMMTCHRCGSGITADEKFKRPQNGNVHRYVYYHCAKSKDKDCKGAYIEEKVLIREFQKLIDSISFSEMPMKDKIKKEIARIKKFQQSLLDIKQDIKVEVVDLKNYAKFILKDGTIEEKRELLGYLNGQIVLNNKKIILNN